MLLLETRALELVGLVLGLLLQPAGPRGELVLLLPRLAPGVERHLAGRREVVDHLAQLVQLLPDGGQFLRIRGQVVAVAPPRFATGI